MATDGAAGRLRLRVKLDAHEFEAVGPPDVVALHFRTWQSLVATVSPAVANAISASPTDAAPLAAEAPELFAVDRERNLVTLRRYPGGRNPHADAALLLLYGFHCSLDGDGRAVPVTRLKAALAASGYGDGRINRTLERYRAAGLVKKRGERKGSTYQLTVTGRQRAVAVAEVMNK